MKVSLDSALSLCTLLPLSMVLEAGSRDGIGGALKPSATKVSFLPVPSFLSVMNVVEKKVPE